MSEFGELIREARLERNITQEKLGELISKSQQFISQLEQDASINIMESWELLPKLSLILQLPIETLVEGFIKDNEKRRRFFYSEKQETIDLFILEGEDTRFFGSFLKTVLRQLGLTTENATKALQIKPQSLGQIAKYCEGKNIPKDKTVRKLTDFITEKFGENLLRTGIRYVLMDRRQRLPSQDILLVNICEGSVDLVINRLKAKLSNSKLAKEISTSETIITSLIYCTYHEGRTSKHMKKVIKMLADYFQIEKKDFVSKFSIYLDAYKKREEIIRSPGNLD